MLSGDPLGAILNAIMDAPMTKPPGDSTKSVRLDLGTRSGIRKPQKRPARCIDDLYMPIHLD